MYAIYFAIKYWNQDLGGENNSLGDTKTSFSLLELFYNGAPVDAPPPKKKKKKKQ